MATWGTTSPARTRSCTMSGSSRTRPSRRLTQLTLRSKRRASSWGRMPKRWLRSRSSQACSSTLAGALPLSSRWTIRASASDSSQHVARTVSCESRRRARMRLYPSTTT